ncbi:MAG TPA: acyltransferase family protein [Vicinamibacterales bacterium]|nr:acyltransferase family protein [Vicinamibacterales bacterium]
MTVIVYGHVTRAVAVTAPIYPKQLGVAFFLFASGFTLARERRPVAQALFKRLFQTWLFAFVLAAGIAVAGAARGTGLALSNFLPLVGANVIFDNFPANPTTWYLGTYLHLLIIWAIWLRKIRIRRWMVVAALALEIPIRAALMATAGRFVAYMLLTNWMAVFLLGLAQGAEADEDRSRSAWPFVVGGLAAMAVWARAAALLPLEMTVPFITLRGWPPLAGVLAVSAAVSALYLLPTLVTFEATRRLAAPAPVRFIARNTPIIFLAHMPVFLALHPVLVAWHVGYAARVIVQLLVCLIGLAALSEAIRRVLERSAVCIELVRARGRSDRAIASPAALMGTPR